MQTPSCVSPSNPVQDNQHSSTVHYFACCLQIAPSEVEAKALTAWLKQPGNEVADLAESEQWLAEISKIPTFISKVSALIFRQQLDEIIKDSSAALQVIDAACSEVSAASGLHVCIQTKNDENI